MPLTMIRCTNPKCHFHNNLIGLPEGTPLFDCPLCGAKMQPGESAESAFESPAPKHWLVEIADNPELWIRDAEDEYPSVIAYEYRSLRKYCREKQPYAVLLCLKDNFEALLKLEVLLAFSWAARNTNDAFELSTVSRLMTPNPSLGTWLELASVVVKDLRKVGLQLPASIPLDKLRKLYISKDIVNWRNSQIGHGAMKISDDEEFIEDIRAKTALLRDMYEAVNPQLRKQELYLKEKSSAKETDLTGADMARGLPVTGEVYLRTGDIKPDLCVHPFIVIRKHEKKGFGIYFFDNQRTRTLTHFLAYAEGSRASETVGYFERLRKKMESAGIRTDAMADDINLSEAESREMDLPQMSHQFVKPEHLVNWLNGCLKKHKRGIFLLQMDRGTGKSVFAEKLNCLFSQPLRLSKDLDVRTYHFSRTQSAGAGDIRSAVEWQWGNEYGGRNWTRAPRISDYEREGKNQAESLCAFLEAVQAYSIRNRGKEKLLMVLDGLDEIAEDYLWNFIPVEEMLKEGIYILLTSRNPEKEELLVSVKEHLAQIKASEIYKVERHSSENIAFLGEYITKTNLKEIEYKDKERLLELSDNRILPLGMLCSLAEAGIPLEDLPESDRVVSKYLKTLNERYGEKESIRLREMLAVLSTLGTYEPLSIKTLGAVTGEEVASLRLIGMIRDLSPMLKAERSEEGNLYTVANSELAKELSDQIPETEEIARWTVNLTMSVMRDESLEKERGLEAAAAHVVELADLLLPEGVAALGENADEVLQKVTNLSVKRMTYVRDRERALDYQQQLSTYRLKVFGQENQKTLESQAEVATLLRNLGRQEEALQIQENVYKISQRILGDMHITTMTAQNNIAVVLGEMGRNDEAIRLQKDLYKKLMKSKGENHPMTRRLMSNLSVTFGQLGYYTEALDLIKPIYKKLSEELGPVHPDTQKAMMNYAGIFMYMGDYKEALRMYCDAYKNLTMAKGKMDDSVLIAQSNMATALEKLGRLDEALLVSEDVYVKYKNGFGIYNKNTAGIQEMIARLLFGLKRYKEALKAYEELCEKYKKIYGEEHRQTLIRQLALGSMLYRLGHYGEALKVLNEVYEKQRKILGEDHKDTLTTKDTIENAQRKCVSIKYSTLNGKELRSDWDRSAGLVKGGRRKEALQIYVDLYEKHRVTYGEYHPDTLFLQYTMAIFLDGSGNYNEALKLYNAVYEKRKMILGEEDSDTLVVQKDIANTFYNLKRYKEALAAQKNYGDKLYKLGRYEETLKVYRDLCEKRKKIQGEESPYTLACMANIGVVLHMLGRYEEALGVYKEAYEQERKELGEGHKLTITTKNNLGSTLNELSRYEEAMQMLREAYESCKKSLGEACQLTLIIVNNFAKTLNNLGHHEEALQMLKEAYKRSKNALGEDDLATLSSKTNLAKTLNYLGRNEEAQQILKEVHEKWIKVCGENHLYTLHAQYSLANAIRDQGRYEEALQIYTDVYEKMKKVVGEDHPKTQKTLGDIISITDKLRKSVE